MVERLVRISLCSGLSCAHQAPYTSSRYRVLRVRRLLYNLGLEHAELTCTFSVLFVLNVLHLVFTMTSVSPLSTSCRKPQNANLISHHPQIFVATGPISLITDFTDT